MLNCRCSKDFDDTSRDVSSAVNVRETAARFNNFISSGVMGMGPSNDSDGETGETVEDVW